MTKFVYIYRIKTTFEYAMGNILEVEAAYNAFINRSIICLKRNDFPHPPLPDIKIL
jgi:hypothetical protein